MTDRQAAEAEALYVRRAKPLAETALRDPYSVHGRGSVLEADLARSVLALSVRLAQECALRAQAEQERDELTQIRETQRGDIRKLNEKLAKSLDWQRRLEKKIERLKVNASEQEKWPSQGVNKARIERDEALARLRVTERELDEAQTELWEQRVAAEKTEALKREYEEALRLMYDHGGGPGSKDYNAVKWFKGRDLARAALAASGASAGGREAPKEETPDE